MKIIVIALTIVIQLTVKIKGRLKVRAVFMIHIVDTCDQIQGLFDNGQFNETRWETYINSIYENGASVFKRELNAYLHNSSRTFEQDFLPLINRVWKNPQLDILHESFLCAARNLNQRITQQFGQSIDAELILYLGLGSSAGRMTVINGIHTVLLGVEKILELNWHDQSSMYGLIYHELGHIYHFQHGLMDQQPEGSCPSFVWQLFTEGVAMYFEQALVGDFHFYHQDKNGWREWCDHHFIEILEDFHRALPSMTRFNQQYFGDWCNYRGYADTGYYLGCRFVLSLMTDLSFRQVIALDTKQVYHLYLDFVHNCQRSYGSRNSLST
ncbi:MAG: hypothetical protein HFG70_03200 [Hungatella sp.]|nr:hypothetical protein [Hungatella sp.]